MFWTENEFEFEKSTEYFRVLFEGLEGELKASIQADVCRHKRNSTRNIELILIHNALINLIL